MVFSTAPPCARRREGPVLRGRARARCGRGYGAGGSGPGLGWCGAAHRWSFAPAGASGCVSSRIQADLSGGDCVARRRASPGEAKQELCSLQGCAG